MPSLKNSAEPVNFGIAGVGGYAGSIANLVLREGEQITPKVRLAAVCDPALDRHAERAKKLAAAGATVYDSYDAMLGHPGLEAVWLPVPIQLHRPFAEQAFAAGKAVMCEKPAAGAIQDVDAMIAAAERANRPAAIGFQDVYDSTTLPLKRRILAGEFGRITSATVHACWPRASSYFSRADWPGRVRMGDTWVLDSPANNALAHYIHIALFLLGPALEDNATPVAVEAELYRAAPIENYDTITARVFMEGGAEFLVLLTHACATTTDPVVTLSSDSHTITRTYKGITIRGPQGEEAILRDNRMHAQMLQRFARAVRGIDDPSTALATLAMAREHTLLINGVSEATPVVTIPEPVTEVITAPDGGAIRAVPGMEQAIAQCAEQRQTLHALGIYDWTRPPARFDLAGYTRFNGPKQSDDTFAASNSR